MFCLCYFLFLNVGPLIRQRVDGSQRVGYCCVNATDEKIPTATNLVNFAPVTPEVLWLICVGCDCREANIRTVLVKGHLLGGSNIASL